MPDITGCSDEAFHVNTVGGGVWCTWICKVAMNSPEKASNTRSMLTGTKSGRKFHVLLP